jgi:hypothetical protein
VCSTILKKFLHQPVDERMNEFEREDGMEVWYGGSSGIIADYSLLYDYFYREKL